MIGFILRRLLQMTVVLTVLSVVLVGLLWLMPGDPVELLISSEPGISAQDVARLRKLRGLDDPPHVLYFKMMRRILVERDLGWSRTYHGVRVSTLIGEKLVNTLQLTATALLLAVLLAVPPGIEAATRRNSAFDYSVNLISFIGVSVPSFWFGIVAIWLFSVELRWLPASGMGEEGLVDRMRHLVLPAGVLTFHLIGGLLRHSRGAMIDVLGEDYIRTARAKGLAEEQVIYKHALRNALIPVITIVALSLPFLFSGALVTETIFAWPGMGRLIYDSIIGKDYYVALVAFMILAALTMVFNLIADLLYAWADPRIRHA